MLTTTGFKNFGFEFDTTVLTVLPGAARLGDTILKFDGTQITYSSITTFSSPSMYQNSLLYLQNFGDAADMTKAVSDETSSVQALDFPELPYDSTVHPLGMFTFYNDGTDISLVSYNET